MSIIGGPPLHITIENIIYGDGESKSESELARRCCEFEERVAKCCAYMKDRGWIYQPEEGEPVWALTTEGIRRVEARKR